VADTVLVDNPSGGRFELRRDGDLVSVADYVRRGDVVTVAHVETNPADRGQGYAATLMAALLEQLRADGLRIRPLCPYAATYLREHETKQDLLAD
jgi:predicted GNAT family acetyltransferase